MLEHLDKGRVHLTGLCLLCPHLTPANANERLGRAEGKTKRQIQELLAELAARPAVPTSVRKVPERKAAWLVPEPVVKGPASNPAQLVPEPVIPATAAPPLRLAPPKPARVEPLSRDSYHIHVTVSRRVKEKLDQALELSPMGTDLESVLESAVDAWVETLVQKRFGVPGRKQRSSNNPGSRYIAKAIKRNVFERDGWQCTFVDQKGRRCDERRGLEFDHIVPYARGGESTAENLRLRCRGHNLLHKEACFGAA
jgi:hypothetical protein